MKCNLHFSGKWQISQFTGIGKFELIILHMEVIEVYDYLCAHNTISISTKLSTEARDCNVKLSAFEVKVSFELV